MILGAVAILVVLLYGTTAWEAQDFGLWISDRTSVMFGIEEASHESSIPQTDLDLIMPNDLGLGQVLELFHLVIISLLVLMCWGWTQGVVGTGDGKRSSDLPTELCQAFGRFGERLSRVTGLAPTNTAKAGHRMEHPTQIYSGSIELLVPGKYWGTAWKQHLVTVTSRRDGGSITITGAKPYYAVITFDLGTMNMRWYKQEREIQLAEASLQVGSPSIQETPPQEACVKLRSGKELFDILKPWVDSSSVHTNLDG